MCFLTSLLSFVLALPFGHCFTSSVLSLDGTWEMAYQPYEYSGDVRRLPEFKGTAVENAVPGYWEDMFEGREYRIHPLYHKQIFPISGTAEDMTLPNIYGCFFYRRVVNLDRDGAAVLKFEGVRNQIHVWVNGRFVAFRQGFSTPFEIEIPSGVLQKGNNSLVLAVSNNPNSGYCDFVSGLTTRSVFRGTGGINGHVELAFPENDIHDIYVTTGESLEYITVHVSGDTPYSWEIPGVGAGTASGDFTLPAKGLRNWSPEDPFLYEIRIKCGKSEWSGRFGVRRMSAEGEKLILNGKPVFLRGVTEHCYFPKTVHVPRDLEYYRMVTAKRKELGFNFVRFHTFVPPVEYLEACDELGMLVHIESPNFVDVPEYESIIRFARSHPSVVIYCTGNETRIDRIAEAYLSQVADKVRSMTDGLFSPMSALRGLEYLLMPGLDAIAQTPWPHNPERFSRVGEYADVYTTYQNSASSYNAINSGYGAADVDGWGDVYQKPRLAHEICIDGTYPDLSTEALYPAGSPILESGLFSGIRKMLEGKGLLDRAETYFRNSCEWQRRCRKFCFEKVRAMKRTVGYDFLGDINTHWHTFGYSVGMMDEFYRLKPGETVENVLRYNSPAVLLNDLGSGFNFVSGETKRISFSISNYDRAVLGASLKVSLVDTNGICGFSKVVSGLSSGLGEVKELAAIEVKVPKSAKPRKYLLKAEFGGIASNEWEIYSFPKVPSVIPEGVKVVSDISREELLSDMRNGKTLVLFGSGPFKSTPATFQIGLPGRCSGNLATVIKRHPALGDFPHEGWCGWQFRHLMEGAGAVQLEAGVPFDPIIDVASSVKYPVRQSFLFEYRVGKGKLLVCSLVFRDDDPAADYLKNAILVYARKMSPAQELSEAQLAAVIDAPLLEGDVNTNNAMNANDPSSSVRADKAAIY